MKDSVKEYQPHRKQRLRIPPQEPTFKNTTTETYMYKNTTTGRKRDRRKAADWTLANWGAAALLMNRDKFFYFSPPMLCYVCVDTSIFTFLRTVTFGKIYNIQNIQFYRYYIYVDHRCFKKQTKFHSLVKYFSMLRFTVNYWCCLDTKSTKRWKHTII